MLKTYCFKLHTSAISGPFAEVLRKRETECFYVRYFVRLKTLRFQGISPHACAVQELVRRRRSRRRILNSIIKERKSDL